MEEVASSSIGELLKRYRIAAGFTQEELAARAGLSARAIRALETGARRTPRKDTLRLLASALNLTPVEQSRLETQSRQRRFAPHDEITTFGSSQRLRPPLVGRQRERAFLDQFLMDTRPALLALAGEPGIGKSRLLEEAAERATERGWTVLYGGCHRRSAQEPYAPLVDALVRFLAARSHAQQRLDVQGCSWLARLLPELAQHTLVPALSWSVTPQQERRLMFAAVARFMANVAGPSGTLLLLDDLHWAGEDALDLLTFLLRQRDGQRLCVIGAYRETDVATRDPLPMLLADLAREDLVARVSLAPLERDEAAQLLSGLFDAAPAGARAVRETILERAGGIPYHLVSCAQAAYNDSLLNGARDFTVPWNVAESIRQRVSLLAEPAAEILAIASVIGRVARRDILVLVARELGHSEAMTLRALEATVRARLLVEGAAGSYTFAHDLVRETLEAEVSSARRATLHRRIADGLERLPPSEDPLERRAAELAWHYASGDALAQATPYALQAGNHAEAIYAHSEAELHYQAAARWAHAIGDHAREGEALEKLADVVFRLARYADAYRYLDQAIRLYRANGAWERLTWATAQIARAGDPLGRVAASLERVERLLTTLAAVVAGAESGQRGHDALSLDQDTFERRAERAVTLLTPQTAARIYLCLMTRYLFLGRYADVHTPSEHAVRYARQAGDSRIESLAYAFRAEAQLALGQIAESAASAEHARECALTCGDLEALYVAIEHIINSHESQAEPTRASDALLQMLDVATQLGDVGYVGETLCSLGSFAFMSGDWTQARRYFEQSVDALRQGEATAQRVPAVAMTLLTTLQEGRMPSIGEEDLDAPGSIGRRASWLTWSINIRTLAEVEILSGQAQRASFHLRRAIEQATTSSNQRGYLLASLAWAQLELGEQAQASATIAEARQLAATQRNNLVGIDIARVDALLALRQERWKEARLALEQSLALCLATPHPYAEAKARSIYGDLFAASGRPEQAREQYAQALAICGRLGERLYRAQIEQALSRLPAH